MKKLTIRTALALGIGLASLTGLAGTASAAPAHPAGGPACIGCW
ncbi:hypothetical protein [Actinomadura rupiterrae]|nr:hypothetical protein [Actinomadura rupiterrae]MCP2343285.1 hypothetical protein [Actinomadura rupiterrae]